MIFLLFNWMIWRASWPSQMPQGWFTEPLRFAPWAMVLVFRGCACEPGSLWGLGYFPSSFFLPLFFSSPLTDKQAEEGSEKPVLLKRPVFVLVPGICLYFTLTIAKLEFNPRCKRQSPDLLIYMFLTYLPLKSVVGGRETPEKDRWNWKIHLGVKILKKKKKAWDTYFNVAKVGNYIRGAEMAEIPSSLSGFTMHKNLSCVFSRNKGTQGITPTRGTAILRWGIVGQSALSYNQAPAGGYHLLGSTKALASLRGGMGNIPATEAWAHCACKGDLEFGMTGLHIALPSPWQLYLLNVDKYWLGLRSQFHMIFQHCINKKLAIQLDKLSVVPAK